MRGLWPKWVTANAVAELFGLGGTALVGAYALPAMDRVSVAGAIGLALVTVAAGAFIEGVTVGLAQGLVLHGALPELRVRSWSLATAAGAGLAWFLGMLPSTVIGIMMRGAPPATASSGGMEDLMSGPLQYVAAAAMGVVLGVVLGGAQAVVLRRHVRRAWRWLPANSIAWALGMPLVFLAAGSVPAGWSFPAMVAFGAAMLLLTGAVVGAIHGAFLVRMLSPVLADESGD